MRINMNSEKTIFRINEQQYLELINHCPEKNHFYRFDECELSFVNTEEKFIIFQDVLMDCIDMFKFLLPKSLKDALILPESIKLDIGFLWNEYLNEPSNTNLEMVAVENSREWIGLRYLLWSPGKKINVATWLYNKNDTIYLEITPVYPWHFRDAEQDEKFIPYDEWIKNYKPLIISEITKDTTEQWLSKTEKIIQEITKADAKYLHTPHE